MKRCIFFAILSALCIASVCAFGSRDQSMKKSSSDEIVIRGQLAILGSMPYTMLAVRGQDDALRCLLDDPADREALIAHQGELIDFRVASFTEDPFGSGLKPPVRRAKLLSWNLVQEP